MCLLEMVNNPGKATNRFWNILISFHILTRLKSHSPVTHHQICSEAKTAAVGGTEHFRHSELLVAVKWDFWENSLNDVPLKLSGISVYVEHQSWGKKNQPRKAD